MPTDSPIIVALDFPDPVQAFSLVDRLEPQRCRLKIGKELFTRGGPDVVRRFVDLGYDVFLDLKYHDIPNTVAGACRAAAELGVWMVNVHALGGSGMMSAAREAVDAVSQPPLLIAVTVLTSMDQQAISEVGLSGSPDECVQRLARLAHRAGLDGVVCSPRETVMLRTELGEGFRLVTPGIRPSWAAKGDQSRITTPAQAVADGSDYLVIGRPVTGAADPLDALARIETELLARE